MVPFLKSEHDAYVENKMSSERYADNEVHQSSAEKLEFTGELVA